MQGVSVIEDVARDVTLPDMVDADASHDRAGDGRQKLLRAARRLIGQRPGRVTTVDEVLREAGVNRRVFYRHFRSKDELVLAMVEQTGANVEAELEAVVAACDEPVAALAAYIEHTLAIGWDAHRSRDGQAFLSPEVGMTAGIGGALEAVYARHRAILRRVISEGRDTGALPLADPDRDTFALHAVLIRHLQVRVQGLQDLYPGEDVGADLDTVSTGVLRLFSAAFGALRSLC